MDEEYIESCSAFDIGCHVEFLSNELQRFFLWILNSILDGLLAFFDLIPLPQFMVDAGGLSGTLPSSVLYFTDVFNLSIGLGIIVSAYIFRFILRRLPFVG